MNGLAGNRGHRGACCDATPNESCCAVAADGHVDIARGGAAEGHNPIGHRGHKRGRRRAATTAAGIAAAGIATPTGIATAAGVSIQNRVTRLGNVFLQRAGHLRRGQHRGWVRRHASQDGARCDLGAAAGVAGVDAAAVAKGRVAQRAAIDLLGELVGHLQLVLDGHCVRRARAGQHRQRNAGRCEDASAKTVHEELSSRRVWRAVVECQIQAVDHAANGAGVDGAVESYRLGRGGKGVDEW